MRAPPPRLISPIEFGIEFVYALLLVALCVYIYTKTRDLYKLTGHKGIYYFRSAFLFFAISYVLQFILRSVHFGLIVSETYLPTRVVFPVFFTFTSVFSTIALVHLIYSVTWKELQYNYLFGFSVGFGIFVGFLSLLVSNPILIILVQLLLTLTLLVTTITTHKSNRIKLLYGSIALFWILEIVVLRMRRLFPEEIKIGLQVISLLIFLYVWYRVKKWIK